MVGDSRVMRWRNDHKEEHRRAKLTPAESKIERLMDGLVALRRLGEENSPMAEQLEAELARLMRDDRQKT